MNLYTVLLVDDEEDVIQIIMKKLDWTAMGFRVVGYAHNGVEALEMAEELQPDVVMTDIKMPYMDGLELSRRLKELYKSVKIIIFSGFDEFEYAKEAIRVEVEEYLLKPVNADELTQVFRRIRQELDQENAERYNMEKLQAYYMESLPLLQENFYNALLEGRIQESQLGTYLANYQIRLPGPFYIVTLIHISTPESSAAVDPFLMTFTVKKTAEEQISDRWDSRVLIYLGNIAVLSQLESEAAVTEYTDAMDEFCRQVKREYNIRVTAGIGQVCRRLTELHTSCLGARNAVSYRALYGNTRAINISEIEPLEKPAEQWEEQAIHEILKKVRTGDRASLEKEVSNCIVRFTESRMSLERYRTFLMVLITELSRFGSSNHLNMEELYREYGDIYNDGIEMESPEELRSWLIAISERMQDMLAKERQDTTRSFVARAIDYVHESYGNQEITIKTVCQTLGVSAAYFSTVFKKETGKTFIGYLTDYRMERAVELLLHTNDKTYIIAEKVGYADPNYFSYAFKKQYGMSPSRYRAANAPAREGQVK